MKIIYQGDTPAAAVLEGDEIRLAADAMSFYIERVAWSTGDPDFTAMRKLLSDLTAPAPNEGRPA